MEMLSFELSDQASEREGMRSELSHAIAQLGTVKNQQKMNREIKVIFPF